MFMDKNSNRGFRNSLAACFAFASEFGTCLSATSFFLDVHVVCQQQQTNLFFNQTAFCIFWKLHDVFVTSLWTRRTFLEFEMSLNLFGNGFEM